MNWALNQQGEFYINLGLSWFKWNSGCLESLLKVHSYHLFEVKKKLEEKEAEKKEEVPLAEPPPPPPPPPEPEKEKETHPQREHSKTAAKGKPPSGDWQNNL